MSVDKTVGSVSKSGNAQVPVSVSRDSDLSGDLIDDHFGEMRELSHFLHDTVAQDLVKLSFFIHELREDAVTAPAPAGIDIKAAIELINRCCSDIRTVTSILAPIVTEGMPLYATIEHYVGCFRDETGMVASTDLDPLPPLPQAVEQLFCYVLQGWLARAVRSDRTGRIAIRMRDSGGHASLELEAHGGKTASPLEKYRAGWAVARARAAVLAGEFTVYRVSESVHCRVLVPVTL